MITVGEYRRSRDLSCNPTLHSSRSLQPVQRAGRVTRYAALMTHLDARRDRYAAILDPGDAIVLIGAGSPVGMPGGFDRVYPFMAHPNYYVLAEQECPGAAS